MGGGKVIDSMDGGARRAEEVGAGLGFALFPVRGRAEQGDKRDAY